MSWIRTPGFLLLFLSARAALAWDHSSTSQIASLLDAGEPVLVACMNEALTPDEPASAALEPEWLSAAESAGSGQHLLSVDCSASDADCKITPDPVTYPSIFLLEADKPAVRYRGPRRAGALLNFLSRRARPFVSPSAANPSREEELAVYRSATADDTSFIAFLPDPTDEDARAAAAVFEEIAWRYRDEFSFAAVVPEAGGSLGQGLKPPAVLGWKRADGKGEVFDLKAADIEALDAWLQKTSVDVVAELTALNRQRLLDRGLPIVYLFASTASERQSLRNELFGFARQHRHELTSVVVDVWEFLDLAGELGLDPNVLPAGAVHDVSSNQTYRFPKDKAFNAASVESWLSDVYAKNIKPSSSTTASEGAHPTASEPGDNRDEL
ncbi:hypothetical protein VTJ83DRAFT_984 [Remersonia thermophila]|uniref:protein disulfide-isomerase n=1 Tax=Remersonia thermophila TaxID=72144 RepID=A0ABR4DMR7_9PEZI